MTTTKKRVFLYTHQCARCGHVWSTLDKDPRCCAGCKNPNWHKPQKETSNGG